MITIYRPIEQLQKKATEAGIPYSVAQILEIGLTLIKSTRDFEKALGEWNALAVAKTWEVFKSHFRDAQKDLKEIRGPTMQQAGYHHANMLASQLRDDLVHQQTEMMAMVQTLAHNIQEENSPPTPPIEQPAVNATMSTGQEQMLQLLRELRDAQIANNTSQSSRTRDQSSRVNRKTPDDANFNRVDTSNYCHTHGACNHKSSECNRKAPGHKNNATRENRRGGSNAFCGQVQNSE